MLSVKREHISLFINGNFSSNNLAPSFKMDLHFWNCFGEGKNHLIAKAHNTDLGMWGHIRKEKMPFYSQINMILTKHIFLYN